MKLMQHSEDWNWRFHIPFKITVTQMLLPFIMIFCLIVALVNKTVEWKNRITR
ncbi:MAG: hypothetical protein WCW03_01045 [Candidatus Paceibacterota bacterium]